MKFFFGTPTQKRQLQGESINVVAEVQEVNKVKETLITVRISTETKFKVVFEEMSKKAYLAGRIIDRL